MAGTIVADNIQAASTSTLVLKNGVANTPPTIQDSAGTQIGTFCRAWVNFNGTTNTGGFCTIRGSFNVTSVADNGTGDYTVNFTTAMPDVNYSAVCMQNAHTYTENSRTILIGSALQSSQTTSSLRILSGTVATGTAGAAWDSEAVRVSIFR
jgi:hypothetical protein